ncbi:MAG TPA: hypothetical protein VJY62_05295 [Bacteroidia bacterium]|nr:hypothetical protein [Bacteroidia bacterium]
MKRICLTLFLLIFLLIRQNAVATHLMGGSLTYEYIGPSGVNTQYHVTLKIYRYCDQTSGGTAALDPSMMLGVYLQDPALPNADKAWFETDNMPITVQQFITPPNPNSNCNFSSTVCVEKGIYETDIFLPASAAGYHLMVERCCRNGNIVNLSNPGSIGQTYYCFIPANPVINSSPVFADVAVPFVCTGDTITVVNNAVDPDGDVLQYSFEIPFIGYSSSVIAVPDPQIDNNPYIWSIPTSLYNPGYSVTQPFGAGGYANIDVNTGQTKYFIPNQGFFVVVIEIKEYRNNVLIASVRRDLQLIAIPCPPNNVPVLSTVNGSGIVNYTINEGQTLCFPITFTDPNGDSLWLTSTGNIFNSAIVNPPASLSNASGNGIVTSQFCWSTDCNQSRPAPYQFNVNVIDNGCPPQQTNQIYSITVNPSVGVPTPAVSIAANPPGPICTGTSVTFTATPTFGGTSPQYQWKINGINVGTNSNTFTSTTLNDGDIITCVMTSNSVCVSIFVANSNPIVITVNPFLAPDVTITANPAGPVCSGTNVTFTAVPVNPGPTPVYQWQVNGINVGTNSATYSSSTLTMGSIVSVSLTSNSNCPAAVSNSITMTVNPTLTPSVTIVPDIAGPICPGASVTFTATPVNGGTLPDYQWQVNGINVGTNSDTYTNAIWTNGDVVQVIMTSDAICVTTPTAASNTIVMVVNAPTSPSVSISANPSGTICAGDNVIFTAVPVLGGSSPSYQWKKNGVNVGTNSSVYASSALVNGDAISVVMTSNSSCATTPTATSNIIVMVVTPVVSASVSIAVSPPFPVCLGTPVTFTATPVNGGTAPYFQWQKNGTNVGTNAPLFIISTLLNADKIRVNMTSNKACVSPVSGISNIITANITPLVTPSVIIAAVPAGAICQGTNVTFTAAPTNGGAAPDYQWQVNGINAGTNSPVFSSSSLTNGSIVKVILTSNANCAVPATVNSNNIVMTVNPLIAPSVSIGVSPAGPVCDGTNVTFTATPTNGGAAPNYQWKINGANAGTNLATFSSALLSDGDVITVVLTSNALCVSPAQDTSNAITMTILPVVTPAVAIASNPGSPVCAGANVTFSANGVNGGTNPAYQWTVNGINVGTNQNSYTTNSLQTGDTVQVQLTSNANCLTTPGATSNILVMTVNPLLTPSVTIVSSLDTICPGTNVIYTATPVNGGSSPVYHWTVNGSPAGNNSNTFSSAALNDLDQIRVQLISNIPCYTTPGAYSNYKVIHVHPNLTPNVTIAANINSVICYGTPMIYTATVSNGGASPHFQWMINGINTGSDTSVFSSSTIQNGNVISVILTSNALCVLPPKDTSNLITTLVDPILTPSISISANPAGHFCDGTVITYSTLAVANPGTNPVYQWQVNGSNVATNSNTFITDQLQDLDTLQCILTSSVHCPSVNPVSSNIIIIHRLPPLAPVITGTDELCYGKDAFLHITASGGNNGPYYYSWDNSLGSDTSYIFAATATTTYTVTVSDSCSTPRSISHTIIVDPLPIPGVCNQAGECHHPQPVL